MIRFSDGTDSTEYPNLSFKYTEEFPCIVVYEEDGEPNIIYTKDSFIAPLELYNFIKKRRCGVITNVRAWSPVSVQLLVPEE